MTSNALFEPQNRSQNLSRRITMLIIATLAFVNIPTNSMASSVQACRGNRVSDAVHFTCQKGKWKIAPLNGTLLILAASSLSDVAPKLEANFRQIYPKTDLVWSFAGSQILATQVINGVPADVFISAGPAPMNSVVNARANQSTPINVVTNSLVIGVMRGNPLRIRELSDLKKYSVSICVPEVPCGALTQKVLNNAGVVLKPTTQELDVKAVVTKISLGEVDAGLIYRTDAIASPNVDAVEFPEAKSFSTTYSAVKLSSSQKNLETRDAFLDYLSSSRAVAIFLNAGFGKA